MRRFFVEPENINGPQAVLTGSEARHISTVLRLAAGAVITLFDGSGSYYEARLTRISPARVEATILSIMPHIAAPGNIRPELHLAVGLLKGKKMDFIIQKITELGLASLRPFRSQYCTAGEPGMHKLCRWQKIAREACKQCNRARPPEIHETVDYRDLLSSAGNNAHDLKLIFWEEEEQQTLRQALGTLSDAASLLILIGPEGGFSAEEAGAAVAAGYQTATLGRRILRAETAVIAAAAILQYELGNLV